VEIILEYFSQLVVGYWFAIKYLDFTLSERKEDSNSAQVRKVLNNSIRMLTSLAYKIVLFFWATSWQKFVITVLSGQRSLLSQELTVGSVWLSVLTWFQMKFLEIWVSMTYNSCPTITNCRLFIVVFML